ncbi:MAG: hypothetical protein AAFR38_09090 [Planctomycetota bacterium]
MDPRFVTKTLHSYLDYPVAAVLMAAPFLLGLGESSPIALWLSVGTGVAALLLTILTDHKTGLIRVLPYKLHVGVDALVGVTFLAAPFALGFEGIDAWYYWANGAAVATVIALSKPEPSAVPA